MVDIRPNVLPAAILPLRSGDALIIDQGADGVRQTDPFSMTDSVAPVAPQAEAVAGADNTKRMTPLRTKQSIASEVGVTLASNTQGAKADSAVQSVNGKSGNSVTLVKGDIGLGSVDNTSDADKPISTATQNALDLKANSSVNISVGTGLTGGGNLTANRTIALNSASIASLAKADSSVQTVNGASPVAGNVTVSAEEKRLQDTRTTAISESFGNNVLFVETAGYSSVGDGGGALYKRVSSEPSHAGKFQSADGAWWEIDYTNGINVFQVGIVGDGITDASAILNSLPVCDVVFPFGNYVVGDYNPHDGITVSGQLGATLNLKTGANAIVSLRTDASDITFKGISFIGNAGVGNPAIRLIGKPTRNNIGIDTCYFSTFGGMAIAFGGVKGAKIRGCYFTKTAQLNIPSGTASLPAIWMSGDDGTSPFDDCRDIEITGCHFEDLMWSALYALGTRINIHANTFKDTHESSIFMSHLARYITVTGNVFDTTIQQNISASAIEVGGAYITITGNTIQGADLYGISLQDCQFFTVSGNTLSFNKTGIVVVTSSATNPPRYGSVTGNSITNSTDYGLYILKVGSGAVINDCKFTGNQIVTSGVSDFHISHTTGVVAAATDINFNHALDSSPSTGSVNMQTFGTANGVVVGSYNFRPKSISIMAVQPGGDVRQSLGEVIFDPTGSIIQRYTRINGTNCTFGGDLAISIENIFTASVTGVRFNTSTNLWEVLANTVRTEDVAVWAIWTAYP